MNAHPTLIGQAPAFQAVIRAARLVAVTDATVLVQGESGTGKELLAREIHHISRRASKPLVVVNCAALPETLVEAELFGYRRGAFTGAQQDYPGRIRSADGGTLFLDEIGELPLSVQAKLLRFLEAGEVQGLGETRPRQVDVRVIAATNRRLEEQVRKGRFREDLWYRLAIVPLMLPPLRERREDILPLARHFLEALSRQHGLPVPTLDRSAECRLLDHPWPGNVRELRNLCERLVILLPGQTVGAGNLQLESPREQRGDLRLPAEGIALDELEAELIRQALERTAGNRTRAARLLGLSRDTLLYRMKKYAIA